MVEPESVDSRHGGVRCILADDVGYNPVSPARNLFSAARGFTGSDPGGHTTAAELPASRHS